MSTLIAIVAGFPIAEAAAAMASRCVVEGTPISMFASVVDLGGVQPAQDWRRNAGPAQLQRLRNGGDTDLAGSGGQRCRGDGCAAVVVSVGLDDGHQTGVTGVFAQDPDVVGDRVEVDDGFRLRGGHAGYRLPGRDHCVPPDRVPCSAACWLLEPPRPAGASRVRAA
ncbi:hypothetical protein Rwratislav_29334 [Rhodococcus wratislaviensis IFP 2016]|nr:hypothetical protein Rwratislav_29334 [Rhodococcus wratislaviensis IFP 2016]